jgi:AcrR family transcriptional regulator
MSENKGEKSKKKLYQAAEELFAQKGLQSTRVGDIVAKADLTQAAFYLYFKSKEDLFQQMLEEFDKQLLQLSDAGKQTTNLLPEDIHQHVKNTFIHLFLLFGRNPNLTRIALQHADDSDQIRRKIVEQISSNMENNQRLSIVSHDIDTQVAAESVVAITEQLVHSFVLTGKKTETELAEQVARIFLNGILKPTEEGG